MTHQLDIPLRVRPASTVAADSSGSIVSGERVLSALYTATDIRQARALSDDDLRCALAIAHAAGDLIAERAGHALRPRAYALAELTLDPGTTAALGGTTGATARQVDRGLELLLASQVLLRVPGRAALRLSRECLVDIPRGVSAGALASIRAALSARHAAVMPALAVARYLGDLAADTDGWVVSGLHQAAARTFFKRSTVARALVDLESVGAIERAHGPGLRGHYRVVLRAGDPTTNSVAAGAARGDALSRVDQEDSRHLSVSGQRVDLDLATSRPVQDSEVALAQRADSSVVSGLIPEASLTRSDSPDLTAAARPAAGSAILEVAGVAFPIPAGVAVQPEFDDQGRLWYRVGSARIGPIAM
jgi:hypothetical protein